MQCMSSLVYICSKQNESGCTFFYKSTYLVNSIQLKYWVAALGQVSRATYPHSDGINFNKINQINFNHTSIYIYHDDTLI